MGSDNGAQDSSTTGVTPTPVDPYASYYQGKLQVTSNTLMPYATVYNPHGQTHQPGVLVYNYDDVGAIQPYQSYGDPYETVTDRAFGNQYPNYDGASELHCYRHNKPHYEKCYTLNDSKTYPHSHDNYRGIDVREDHHREPRGYHQRGYARNEEYYQRRSSYDYDERRRNHSTNTPYNYHEIPFYDEKHNRNESGYENRVQARPSHGRRERYHYDDDRRENENSGYDDYGDQIFPQRSSNVGTSGSDERIDSLAEREEHCGNMSNFEYEHDYSSLPESFGSKRKAQHNAEPVKKLRSMKKYQRRKYNLFHRFDEGIRMDDVSWYSVTPETIAKHHARRFRSALPLSSVVLDAFLGGAGNSIQLALEKLNVLAIELCAKRLEIAKHNAGVYGVGDNIDYILGNAYHLIPVLKGVDAVLLSPPWGGPEYLEADTFDSSQFVDLVEKARALTPNIAILLPKNIDFNQATDVFDECEVEQNWDEDGRMRMMTIYFGCLVRSITTKETGPTWVDLSEDGVYENEVCGDTDLGGGISPVSVQQHSKGSSNSQTNTQSAEESEKGSKEKTNKDEIDESRGTVNVKSSKCRTVSVGK